MKQEVKDVLTQFALLSMKKDDLEHDGIEGNQKVDYEYLVNRVNQINDMIEPLRKKIKAYYLNNII
jgi:hypothetical protein